MDELYDLEGFTYREVKAMYKGLETITIQGIDAMFIGMLQAKLLQHIKEIDANIAEQQNITDNIPPPPIE
jgi:ABC-type uncharacterized transport system permease subunit